MITSKDYLRSKTEFSLLVIIFIFAVIICLYYGRRGFMPLDHSIIFDGAWRIISGQVPFRDFTAPNGIVPIFIQSVFFRLFGVSWFIYVLHAALVNGIFCVLVFVLLRLFRASKPLSFFYAFLSGIIYYPPMGVPFADQHALIFILCVIVIAVKASKTENNLVKTLCWFFIPFTIALAYLSKQIPSVFAVPVVILLLFLTEKNNFYPKMILSLVCGIIFTVAILFAIFKISQMELSQLKLYFIELPFRIGLLRLDRIFSALTPVGFLTALFYPRAVAPLAPPLIKINSFTLVYAGLIAVFLIQVYSFLDRGNTANLKKEIGNMIAEIILAVALIMICNLFIMFTLNQVENGIPFIFVSVGIIHNFLLKSINTKFLISKKIIFTIFINMLFVYNVLSDAVIFNKKINNTRAVNDLLFVGNKKQVTVLPSELQFMFFSIPDSFYKFQEEDLKNVAQFLIEKKENFFLFGDTSILYALTRKPSVNPTLWFHGGLTLPQLHSDKFKLYEDNLIKNINKYKVRYIVIEGDAVTFMGVRLTDFSRVVSLIKEKECSSSAFGWFKVIELRP
ncbi:MAG: hypothetical protein NT033_05380 [Candidatus Omnitrophica bacterium]|nr:hypothetical protein [Candidatus Omnitrophota bacterium]